MQDLCHKSVDYLGLKNVDFSPIERGKDRGNRENPFSCFLWLSKRL